MSQFCVLYQFVKVRGVWNLIGGFKIPIYLNRETKWIPKPGGESTDLIPFEDGVVDIEDDVVSSV